MPILLKVPTHNPPTDADPDPDPYTYAVDGEAVSRETFAAVEATRQQQQECRMCGRIIFWRRFHTNQSRWMPIDYEPSNQHGNIVLVGRQQYRVLLAVDLKSHRPAGQIRYTSHMHTCPYRAKPKKETHPDE